jgi:hypothetical protein
MKYNNIRCCGQIAGALSEIQPFIYIFRRGGMGRELRNGRNRKKKGIFGVNEQWGSSFFIKNGVILPLSTCRDEKIKTTLLELKNSISRELVSDGASKRRKTAQEILDPQFGESIKIASDAGLNGFVEFDRNRAFFQMLADNFDYLEEVFDDPDGIAKPTALSPFSCRSYGEYLEWYYDRMEPSRWGWEHCIPSLVFEGTGYLDEFMFYRNRLERPSLAMDKLFVIKPEISDSRVSVFLDKHDWDCIPMSIEVGSRKVTVILSNVFPPLEILIAWLKQIKVGDVPVAFEVDEEGTNKKFSVFPTNDPDRVYFRVENPYAEDNESAFVDDIVDRHQLAEAFRDAISDFFKLRFNPDNWYGGYDIPEDGHIGDKVLADPWFQ